MPSRNKILAMCLQDRLYFNLFMHVTGISRKCMTYYCGMIYRNYPITTYPGLWRDLNFRSNLSIVRPIYFVFFLLLLQPPSLLFMFSSVIISMIFFFHLWCIINHTCVSCTTLLYARDSHLWPMFKE